MEAPEESTLLEIPSFLNLADSLFMMGTNCGCAEIGTMSTFVGATARGSDRT